MNIKKKIEHVIASLAVIAVVLFQPLSVYADEYEVSGNGSGSTNEVNISSNSQTNVEQSNQAEVTNNLESTANTGENTASSNTGGDTTITTGDVSQAVGVENNTNASVANIECCPSGENNLAVSGNGADSTSNIGYTSSSQTSVNINQKSNIINDILGNANTGNNSTDNNTGGNTSIETGNISVKAEIGNSTNFAFVTAPSDPGGKGINVKIFGNGSGSTNSILLNLNSSTDININNDATISNFLLWQANTGGNTAKGNTGGDVSIKTGNIVLDIILWNKANISIAKVPCCEEKEKPKPTPTPTPAPTPTPTPSNGDGDGDGDGNGRGNGGGGGGAAGPGEVLGAAFPVTGWGYLNLTLTALLFMLSGLLLWANSKSIAKRAKKFNRKFKREYKKIRVLYLRFVKIARWKKLLSFWA